MKAFFNIPHKYKISLLLLIIVSSIIISSLWENSTITRINESFSSIYKDRLIPANELFHISDLMYQKRLLLTDYLEHPESSDLDNYNLQNINKNIDSILHEYEKTYLVAEEDKSLSAFKIKIETYNNLESKIMSDTDNAYSYNYTLLPLFDEIRNELITLSQIQTSVGKDLMNGSNKMQANSSVVHYCQLAIVLVLMLIVQSIIFSAKSMVPKRSQKFWLN